MKEHIMSPFSPLSSPSDPAEIARFNALAQDWWDADGPMAPLHRINPVRMQYINQAIEKYNKNIASQTVLDVGCGGGLVCEPLARLGAQVTGIDGAADLIAIARDHAAMENLDIDYRANLTDELIAEKSRFNTVMALEVIEHVPDTAQFIRDIAALTAPKGLAIFSTLNRTASSMALGVVAAEYVMRWLPRGTHDWRKFVKPSELHHLCTQAGLEPLETMGLVYRPLRKEFELDPHNLRINYFLVARKK